MLSLRRVGTLRVVAAIVVLLGTMPLAAHAAVRSSTTPTPSPGNSAPSNPDQTQPQPQTPGPSAPLNQPSSSSTTQPAQSGTATTASGPTREVFGFTYSGSLGDPNVGYPSWNFNLLSTVAFFSLHATFNGNLVADSDWGVFNSSTFTNFVNTAHAHGVKVVVTISPQYGFSDFTDFCDTLYNSPGTVTQLVPQVIKKGIDGVNIDYEGQLATCHSTQLGDQSDQSLVTQLAQNLRNGLNNAGAGNYLTIDTYSGSALGNDGFFNIPDLNQYVDAFFVMAYDMDFSNSTSPPLNCTKYCHNPVSPLTNYYWNVTNSMSTYSTLVGSGKVILGQPYYGEVSCVNYPYAHAYPTGQLEAASYLGAASVAGASYVKPGTYSTGRDSIDATGLDAWTTWYDTADHCWREMYWDDTTSLATKYNLVNRDNLRGVGLWTLNYGGGAPELWDLLSAYFQTWSAGYDTSQSPRSWVAGQTQTFPVTVTNSGSYTWPSGGGNPVKLDLHFATSPSQAATSWLTSQVFSLPSDVAPGASVTFNVTVTAPMNTGALYLEAEMLKSQQFWFAQRQPILLSVVPQAWTATYDMSQAPTGWQSGQTKTFSVSVTNGGNVTWPSSGPNAVELDLHFTSKAGGAANESSWLTSQTFPLATDLAPGQSATVSVTVTAPATTGYLSLEAGVFKNGQFWFAQAKAVSVTVYGAFGAGYDMSQAPTSWAPGDTKTFQVTLTNQGTQAWPSGGANAVELDLHFTTVAGGSAREANWLTSQLYPLSADVAPGATVTLTVTATAPSTSGNMSLEAQLFKNHQFWFQQWQAATVTVAALYTATYDMTQAPTSWVAGQSQTFPVTVTNAGNVTWPATGYTEVDLDLHFANSKGGSANSAQWLTSQAFSLPGNVAPGASVTVNVTVTAPANAGSPVLEAEMIKEHQLWFQQWQPVNVTVVAASWSASYDMTKAPTTWTHGQTQTFTVTVTNIGNVTWPSTGYTEVDLDLHFTTATGGSAQSSQWLTSQAFALPGNVAPNASVTVTVTITAPSTTGSMSLEAELIKEHQFWFQQWSTQLPVTVS